MKQLILALLFFATPLLCAEQPAEPIDQYGKQQPWRGSSGRITVIDFAAAWCRPCWSVLPRLQTLAEEHSQVAFVVVSVDERQVGRDRLVRELKLEIPVLWDEYQTIAKHYRPGGMPATFVVGPTGEVLYSHVGSGQREWAALVDFLEDSSPARK